MPRRQRRDEPNSFHHVYNRAIARRTMFETREDIRFFLAQVAGAVRRGQIRVIAYSILTTHFHLFVESLGNLAKAMRHIQSEYSRYFNRSRKRDGALARGRFASKRVDSARYAFVLVGYIDRNPVQARVVRRAVEYEYGSARDYALGIRRPWLERGHVEEAVQRVLGRAPEVDRAYEQVFGAWERDLADVVERRLRFADTSEDPLDDLVGAAPERVLAWMRRKAALADGTEPGLPVASRHRVVRLIDERRADVAGLADLWGLSFERVQAGLTCGLLRLLAGMRHREIALEGIPESTVGRYIAYHRLQVLCSVEYATLCAELARATAASLPAPWPLPLRRPAPAAVESVRS